MSQTRNAFRASALFFAGIAAAFWTAAMLEVRAQQLVQGSSLKLADYYPAPHETQMKSLVQGQRARPQGAGKVLIDQARLETFRETGDHEFVAEAPQCLLDQTSHVLQSPGPIEVRTADGKFVLDGEGFLWLQTNSVLFISNHVHTTIQPELMSESPEVATKASGQAKRPPVEIFSDRFKYERQTGLAVYRENVRASGTNMALASSVLTMVLPMAEHQLKSVTADESVVMDYSGVHATGEHATYDVATEIAHVTGHPSWQSEQREGRGDDLLIDRTNKIFTTAGHAFLKLPSGNSTEGLFAASTNAAPGRRSTNNFIEITSEQYIVLTNSAVFHDGVRVTQLEGNEIKGGMDCRRLDVTFAGTNQIETLLAQTNVVIEQKQNGETNRFLAERGFYTATNGILKLTGNPKWQAGKRQGKGDVLYVNAQKQTLDAVSNAWMRLPASELAANIPGDSSPSKASGVAAPQLEFADIYCHDYTVSAQNAVFREKVRVRHPKMDWDSDEITVTSSPGPEPKRIGMVANRNVVFQLVQPSGQQVHGKCDTAFYDYAAGPMGTNDVLRLTGNAILETTNGTLKNNIIILDHGENKLIAPGNYVIYGTASAFGTNSLAPKL